MPCPLIKRRNWKPWTGRLNANSRWHRSLCLFCEKLYAGILRQMAGTDAQALALKKRSNKRRTTWLELVKEGDFYHTYTVLEKKQGIITPKYKASREKCKSLCPCPCFKARHIATELWGHQKLCVLKDQLYK